jgi:hypothetical protein
VGIFSITLNNEKIKSEEELEKNSTKMKIV